MGDVLGALEATGAAVLVAPPGAGKTTRVPAAMLDALPSGEVLVLEPRRIAARLAAGHVARERGGEVGQEVGYTVRHDDRRGPRTRLRFVTTGVAVRGLAKRPHLRGVSAVVFDELHERHALDDLLLAWVAALRRGPRPDLRVLAMSATLDPGPVAAFLGGRAIRSEGRVHPVEITYASRIDSRALPVQVAGAVRGVLGAPGEGDILCFLPGVREIERCRSACAAAASEADVELWPLHGGLEPREIRAALSAGPRRRVLLATNIAESSVTLPRVTTVIDSGLHRVARCSPWTGLRTLDTEPVPRDSADQRAGRAGRVGPGRCVRLYTEADYRSRPDRLAPEIRRTDLAPIALTVAQLGPEGRSLRWLEAPEPARWVAATKVLVELGAVASETGELTDAGHTMLSMPLHPRLARLALDAPDLGPLAASLLSEGARLPTGPLPAGESDVLALVDCLEDRALPHNLVRRVRRAAADVRRQLPRSPRAADPREALLRALLHAFPDHVARRREQDRALFVLAGGGNARQDPASTVRVEPWVVAVDATGGGRPFVRLASAIEPDWLYELPSADDALTDGVEVTWSVERERVEAHALVRWRNLVLESRRVDARELPEATEVLRQRARQAGLGRFADADAVAHLRDRCRVAHEADPSVPGLTDADIAAALDGLCASSISFKELRQADLLATLRDRLTWPQRKRLDALCPERIQLASGYSARVRYLPEGPPRISARVQHFLGMEEGPRLGGGRVPVLLELLAPNNRPVQLTDDLAGFWDRTWPQVRKELRGRYAKHAWPEDPRAAPVRLGS